MPRMYRPSLSDASSTKPTTFPQLSMVTQFLGHQGAGISGADDQYSGLVSGRSRNPGLMLPVQSYP